LRTAFGLPEDRVVVTGDPRDDVLCQGSAQERRARAHSVLSRLLPLDEFRGCRLLLYAPTWRDGERDPGVPSAAQWIRIARYLQATDSVLLVRPHPLGVGEYAAGTSASDRILLLTARQLSDITPVLPAVDTLITDYSSIAYDFALTGSRIVFLAPDLPHYIQSRGLYQEYSEFSGGSEVSSWDGVVDLLELCEGDPKLAAEMTRHVEKLRDEHHEFRDGRNTERVYLEIRQRLKARA
jgi:CDP-glycerol glycerophosphotransferase (TagB/SpsB family)